MNTHNIPTFDPANFDLANKALSNHSIGAMNLTFTNQYVADLAWVIDGPLIPNQASLDSELIKPQLLESNNEIKKAWYQELEKLNINPTPLVKHMEARRISRVGFYYEALISYLLTYFPGVELLTEHLQLNHNGKTLGEVDFIYQRKSQRKKQGHNNPITIHLETAVKFYLGSSAWLSDKHHYYHWLGPMIKDRLDLKTEHLIHHQSQSCQSIAYQEIAKEKSLPIPDQRQVRMQGYLFTHPELPVPLSNTMKSNQDLYKANQENQPFWIKDSELENFLNADNYFLVLKKPFWLGPYHDSKTNKLLNYPQLKGHIDELMEQWNRPILVALFKKNISDTFLHQEYNRCFIVPDSWAGNLPPK